MTLPFFSKPLSLKSCSTQESRVRFWGFRFEATATSSEAHFQYIIRRKFKSDWLQLGRSKVEGTADIRGWILEPLWRLSWICYMNHCRIQSPALRFHTVIEYGKRKGLYVAVPTGESVFRILEKWSICFAPSFSPLLLYDHAPIYACKLTKDQSNEWP